MNGCIGIQLVITRITYGSCEPLRGPLYDDVFLAIRFFLSVFLFTFHIPCITLVAFSGYKAFRSKWATLTFSVISSLIALASLIHTFDWYYIFNPTPTSLF